MSERRTDRRKFDEPLVAFVVTILLVAFSVRFGSHDIEESTNTAYSAGPTLGMRGDSSLKHPTGIYTIWGVPVFDSLQATGNRLPYQGSWAQSVSWPLRLIVSWEFLQLVRSSIFSVAALWLCMKSLKSWVPGVSRRRLFLFGLFLSSSFGLYVRENEWSDQFVQTLSILGVTLFLLRSRCDDDSTRRASTVSRLEPVMLFFCVNGVVTGHPGHWAIAGSVWGTTLMLLIADSRFRLESRRWARRHVVPLLLIVGSSTFSAVVVVVDLIEERKAQAMASSASQMWQGFIGDQLLRGATNGFLPDFLERMLSLGATSLSLPLLKVLATIAPFPTGSPLGEVLFRASESFPRGEFVGSSAVLVALWARRCICSGTVRELLDRLLKLEVVVAIFAILCLLDVIPVTLAPSALFNIAPVLLGINVFVLFIVQGNIETSSHRVGWAITGSHLMVALWLVLQLGFGVVPPQLPEHQQSWFADSRELHDNPKFKRFLATPDRLIIADARSSDSDDLPKFESFLPFVGLGIPVVAPSNPKIRDTTQLVSNIAFRNTLDVWSGLEAWPRQQIDQVLDFLQIRYVAVELTNANGNLLEHLEARSIPVTTSRAGLTTLDVEIGKYRFRVVKRTTFAAEVRMRTGATLEGNCAILEQRCLVDTDATRRVRSSSPSLSLCANSQCIWEFNSPTINPDEQLVLPITYDEALTVSDVGGSQLEVSDIGGFLAVAHPNGIGEGELIVTLDPDIRMLSRVFVSYVNLGVFLVFLGAVLQPWIQSRRNRPRVD